MKILFIAGHEFLYNPQNGGQKCSLRNYSLLQDIFGRENIYLCMFSNYQYDKLPKNAKIFNTHRNNFQRLVNTIMLRNVCSKSTLKELKTYINALEVDLIFADASFIGKITKKIKGERKVVTFFHNIEKGYAWNKFKHEGFKFIIAFFSYYFNEKEAVRISDGIILLNKRDEVELKKIYGRNADFFLPITFKDTFKDNLVPNKQNKKFEILFVGSMFQPNYEGIVWFIDKVMSKLDSDKFVLKLVGKDLEQKKKELERENVTVIGTVDEVDSYYYGVNLVVLPIFYGNGMKVKTAEAMMYGKKILATKEALEGYEYGGVEEIKECNTESDFVNAILQSYGADRKLVYRSVRKLFIDTYDTEVVKKKTEEFINKLIIEE